MKEVKVLLQHEVRTQAYAIAVWARAKFAHDPIRLFGVPRGGVAAAYLVASHGEFIVVDRPEEADLVIDDIVDSGATRRTYCNRFPNTPFRALYEPVAGERHPWYVFPWEASSEGSADDIPRRLLQFIGEDPTRAGLKDTPARFLKAWAEYTSGYRTPDDEFKKALKVFEDGAEGVNEMVVVRDIPVYSMCEHHMAPFFGSAHVAYIPRGRVLGLSKIARVVDHYARRLQVQERLTQQVAGMIKEAAATYDVGVVIRCRHMCMEQRGVRLRDSTTVTSAMWGVLRDSPSARAELLALVR